MIRAGIGYDSHRLTAGRPLILGGVDIPFEKGLLGHSDADVLLHAVCDALLGALGEGDIGKHFPDTDPAFKDVSSLKLLRRVCEMAETRSHDILNVDATIIQEKPKLKDYLPEMVKNIARTCRIPPDRVNVKATTNEGMGFIGRGEGVAAMAVVLIGKRGV